MNKIYKISKSESPWGDYGRILIHGLTAHLDRKEGLLQLERTGPYVPPITFPGIGNIIVTSSFLSIINNSKLSGISFQPVIKAHIVKLDWKKWNLTNPEPDFYPESGEPEDYILEREHSEQIADELGNLYELILRVEAEIDRKNNFSIYEDSIPDLDFFMAKGVLYNYVSEKAKHWLSNNASEYISFEEIRIIKRT